MTDNEIIKALECCNTPFGEYRCCSCPLYDTDNCKKVLRIVCLNLINRQKAEIESNKAKIKISAECIARQDKEIERLHNENAILTLQKNVYNSEIKTEAIKEFAEKLCEDRVSNDPVVIVVKVALKEMVGENNG